MELPEIPIFLAQEIQQDLTRINTQKSVFDALKIAYDGIEKISEFLKPYFPCHKGCSSCCKYDVLITTFEAEYIMLNTGKEINRSEIHTKNNNSACPFLDNNNYCSIYNFRPMICRMYHSLEHPDKCKKENHGFIKMYGVKESGYGNIIFKYIAEWIYTTNAKSKGQYKDIRNFF
jgi:Fe-S-cluster containining protein